MQQPSTATPSARVYVVEDHPVYRDGLIHFLNAAPDLTVCGTAATVEEALAGLEATQPDLALVDLQLQGSSGFDLIELILARRKHCSVMVLTMYEEQRFAERLLRAGVMGYVMKHQEGAEILKAIRTVLSGTPYLSHPMQARMMQGKAGIEILDRLSDRELQVFQLLGEGLSVAQVAKRLARSPKTIQNHADRIRKKLQFSSRQVLYQQAQLWALKPMHGPDAPTER